MRWVPAGFTPARSSRSRTRTPRHAVSSFDQRVTQWMSTVTSAWGSAISSSHERVSARSTSPSTRRSQAARSKAGFPPTVSTGNFSVMYWPGGTRSGSIPSFWACLRPRAASIFEVIAMPGKIESRDPWPTSSPNPASTPRTIPASKSARSTASIRLLKSPTTTTSTCSTSTRRSASTATPAWRLARSTPASPRTSCQTNGRTTSRSTPTTTSRRPEPLAGHRQRRSRHLGHGRARGRLEHRQLLRRRGDDPAGGVEDRLRGRRVGLVQHERPALVGAGAQLLLQRDLAEQRHVQLVREQLAAALAEDREALSARRREAGHVLDHAGDLEVEALCRVRRALRHLLRGGLRRRHDHELRLREQLRQRHRHVPGARRQIDQEVVELAPVHVLEELADRLVQHRAAPGDRLVLLVEEELDRDHLHSGVGVERQDLALCRHHRPAVHAEHARDRVAPHVGIERRGLLALHLERGRQVGGDRGLADPALARADADDVLDGRERSLREPALAAEALGERLLLLVREDVEADLHVLDAQRLHVLDDRLLEVGPDRAARRGERHDDVDPAFLGLLDRAHHPQGDDVLAQLGVDDVAKRVLDLVLAEHPPLSVAKAPTPPPKGRRRLREERYCTGGEI